MEKSQEELEKEYAEGKVKLEQYQHRGQRYENRIRYHTEGERKKLTHRLYEGKCSAHYIRAVVLEEVVWAHIKTVISYVTCHEVHFRAVMERRMKLNSEDAVQVWKKHLKKAEQRIRELDQMFIRLYEDNVKGRISDDR